MSTDQRLLYDASKAVIDGCCPAALAKRTIGPVSHARWLTTAVRILFLYMSTVNPSPEVTQMATFVISVYSYLWFTSKYSWKATEASQILFKAMQLISKLSAAEQALVCPVIERGFFWGHPEQLLLGCLGSDDADIRARAVSRIIAIRSNPLPRER